MTTTKVLNLQRPGAEKVCSLPSLVRKERRLKVTKSIRCPGINSSAIKTKCIAVDYYSYASPSYSSPNDWKSNFEERYEIVKNIGKGSFGQVWLAIDKSDGKRVAVKELSKIRGRLSEERTFEKIEREISVMKDIQKCIEAVRLYECYVLANSYNIVMEYCSGKDLKYHLKSGNTVSECVAAAVAYEILQILKVCHSRRIVHGDVKTANFMLANNMINPFVQNSTRQLPSRGWLKGIDFGCSQYILDGSRIHSRVGTPVFMAPEVFERNYSFESDLWSLGIITYQLLTGRYPFWDTTDSAMMCSVQDVMATISLRDPDFYSDPWNDVSSSCLNFISSLLDKNYSTRMTVSEALSHPFITNNVPLSGNQVVEHRSNILPGQGMGYKTVQVRQ